MDWAELEQDVEGARGLCGLEKDFPELTDGSQDLSRSVYAMHGTNGCPICVLAVPLQTQILSYSA